MKAIAVSGGVDSSVAALLAREAARPDEELVLIHLHLWEGEGGEAETSCCTPESTRLARSTADLLGLPFYTFNMSELFMKEVVDPFKEGYARGLTPNPCVTCNRKVKFGALAKAAAKLGARELVTGHYVRASGQGLFEARDSQRDQSYFLYGLPLSLRGRLHFPLGELTKEEVRDLAARKGLPSAGRPDSQEVCFVPAQGYRLFLERHQVASPVGILATAGGRVLGKHGGIQAYTRGQRAGIAGSAQTLYVLSSDPGTGTVTVGPEADLMDRTLDLEGLRGWNLRKLDAGSAELRVRARYRGEPMPCRVFRRGRSARVELEKPLRAAAPGQSAVFYSNGELVGGGIIRNSPKTEI